MNLKHPMTMNAELARASCHCSKPAISVSIPSIYFPKKEQTKAPRVKCNETSKSTQEAPGFQGDLHKYRNLFVACKMQILTITLFYQYSLILTFSVSKAEFSSYFRLTQF